MANRKQTIFLQLFMDANRIQATIEKDLEMTLDDKIDNESPLSQDVTTEGLSEEEIVSNSLLFLAAGLETVSATLQFIIHNLVNHQDIQEKLRKDIRRAIDQNGGFINFKTVNSIPLLSHVIKETLRMYAPVSPFTTRVAEKDYEYQGIRIPKGTGVFIGVSAIHNDPQLWPEPEKFIPERFQHEFNKMAFLPFGAGPRNCIGMRFAYMELQLALAFMVHKYRFEPGPSTEKNITTTENFATLAPKYGVFCKVVKLE